MQSELKTGPWNLTDLKNVTPNGLKVFSIFSCGGGSTMGYKLAGYEVIGCCEIDPQMMRIYRANHNPRLPYLMGVQEFKSLPDLPKELFELDILDGSPPCSSFSMAGSREKAWGDKKKFREGQAEQVLDNLFFDFIEVAKRLQPKVVVAENVKGLIQGNARGYVKEIFQGFKEAGYQCQLFLLNAAAMGVPQRRERTFFIANRLDKNIRLEFSEPEIPVVTRSERLRQYKMITAGNVRHFSEGRRKNAWPCISSAAPTATATENQYDAAIGFPGDGTLIDPVKFNTEEKIRIQTFPDDFNFLDSKPDYVCGMSVPPFMMQRVADQIYKQFFSELK